MRSEIYICEWPHLWIQVPWSRPFGSSKCGWESALTTAKTLMAQNMPVKSHNGKMEFCKKKTKKSALHSFRTESSGSTIHSSSHIMVMMVTKELNFTQKVKERPHSSLVNWVCCHQPSHIWASTHSNDFETLTTNHWRFLRSKPFLQPRVSNQMKPCSRRCCYCG